MGKASRLFNGQAEHTLYERVTPTTEQREFLQQQWNELADYLKAELTGYGYPITTWLQGSYKYGTLIKPVHRDEEYDVDLGIYFDWDPKAVEIAPTAQQLRTWVQRELLTFKLGHPAVKDVADPPKERCSRAIYAKRFHIDTPTYHLDSKREKRELATLSGQWEDSDPKAIYKWFKGVVSGDEREQLRRLIRYLKAWAAIAFETAPDSRPSSIVLTVLVANIYSDDMWLQRLITMDDDDALITVIKEMHKRLNKNRDVLNPVNTKESLNRIPSEAWGAFLTRLQLLYEAAESAEAAEDEVAAALAWSEALTYLMPLPETDVVEVSDPASTTALMQIPEVKIEVATDWSFKNILQTHRNEVPGVAKGQCLRFTIINPQIIPAMAMIEWTVRNEGEDADYLGDLGHTRGGMQMFTVEEGTKYAGKQYMDLTVRCNGSVYAVRRISVLIEDRPVLSKPKATPRAWTTLRSRKGRRR
ncbi:cyclic GMP-AMP synthase DncV-like nucleotidyltransferase [Polaromonas sp. JS666]|uniref:CBASS cGAMP synthase n=1 Tax=Polaromonas sp. (strain JS666 / ATCC BAA-500) TaxID=296591 RepID=UPI0008908AED|nr:hypothetical protein [Polaromonas sp. JS666]SDM43061.1 hypothetical protein SAMN05720382_101321 [Polaromonas sp. JS666]